MRGFTLIELMIVVAIIGILMAYAIPAYRDYTVRTKRNECNVIVDGLKSKYTAYKYETGNYPTLATDLGLSSFTGTYLTAVSFATAGQIECDFDDNEAGDGLVTWTANYIAGDNSIKWSCDDTTTAIGQRVCPK